MRLQLSRLALSAALVLGVATVPATQGRAQAYPNKSIRFIVPFPAGGATDAAARAIQPQLEKILGQTVVVENRAGAGAVIGLDTVAKSAPDGYTIGLAPAGAMSDNPAMGVRMPFDVRKDLVPISNLAETAISGLASSAVAGDRRSRRPKLTELTFRPSTNRV